MTDTQWISVEERLPDFKICGVIPIIRLLIAIDGEFGYVGEASYYPKSKIFERGGAKVKPSHWQPLPEPPR